MEKKANWNTWDYYIERLDKLELTAEQKKNTILAINFLNETLGKHFLKEVGQEHGIFKKLIEGKHESIRWLAWIINHFRKSQEEFDEVVLPLIRSVKKFKEEALPFLEIGGAYANAGFDVKFLKEIRKESTPDIELIDKETQQKIFVEVSQVRERKTRVDIGDFYWRMSEQLMLAPHILQGGRFLAVPDNDREAELIAELLETKNQAYREKKFLSVDNEFAVFGFAPEECEEELRTWLNEKMISVNSIMGPPFGADETSRIVGFKIADKASQLPADQAGLIYLTVQPEHFLVTDVADEEFIETIKWELGKHPQVLGLALYAKLDADVEYEGIIYRGLNCHVIKNSCDGVRLDLIFVFNDKCKIPILPGTMNSLYKVFSAFRVT